MSLPFRFLMIAGLVVAGWSTTLQQLSLDDIALKSTYIVRGTAVPSYSSQTGPIIYTHYRLAVSEQWKGSPGSQMDVAVPGGTFNGTRQAISGSPNFADGGEYVFFLWKSPSGLIQVIGLTQGLFSLVKDSTGNLIVNRPPSGEMMVDPKGQKVTDSGFTMKYTDFKQHVSAVLGGGSQ